MLVLALDCSTPRALLCIGRIDLEAQTSRLLAANDDEDAPNQASARIVPRIQQVLAHGQIDLSSIEIIGCGRGPGTFTGSRVAVATAKGLAVGLGIPVAPVSTLAIVAASARVSGNVLATLDARRGEVYAADFECGEPDGPIQRLEATSPERCAPLHEIIAAGGPRTAIAGLGATVYGDAVPGDWTIAAPDGPSVRGLWAATARAIADGAATDPAAVAVTYLRKSHAELGMNRPKRPFVRSPFV